MCIDILAVDASLGVVSGAPKTAQLQIRVTRAQKAEIARNAKRAGMDVSKWVLSRLLPPTRARFHELVRELARTQTPSLVLAEFHDLLVGLPTSSFASSLADPPLRRLDARQQNLLAAMVEHAAAQRAIAPPAWTKEIEPLPVPDFASDLQSLRLHLLVSSPPAYRRRNLFVDAVVGDRV